MNTITQNDTFFNRIRKMLSDVTTMDPRAVRMFERNHVELRRTSRIWMV
jgi:hypothetical protein